MKTLSIKTDIHPNRQAVATNREMFNAARTIVITVVGPAGSGKTAIIEELMKQLAPPLRIAAVICNLDAGRQVSRISRHGYPAYALETDSVSAADLQKILPALNLRNIDILFIEIDSNGSGAQEQNLGQHFQIGVFSAAGGDDKVNEFPRTIAASQLLVLTKTDQMSFVKFDFESFQRDVWRINHALPIVRTSVHCGAGITACVEWIELCRSATLAEMGKDSPFDCL